MPYIMFDGEDFPSSHDHLNTNFEHWLRRVDIVRAYINIGHSRSRSFVWNGGLLRVIELLSAARNYLRVEYGSITASDRYLQLPATEKGTRSTLFGQAITALLAERLLDCTWVANVEQLLETIQVVPFYHPPNPPKRRISSNTNGRQPDLIGIGRSQTYHVLEAKGTVGGYSRWVHQQAINQVSQVARINGVVPVTKCACHIQLATPTIRANVIDPEGDDVGLEINFEDHFLMERYYSLFNLDDVFEYGNGRISEMEFGGIPFQGFRLDSLDAFFGIHPQIYELIQIGDWYAIAELVPSLSEALDFGKNWSQEGWAVSVGPDGMLLALRNEEESFG